jgi:hypothetical protein
MKDVKRIKVEVIGIHPPCSRCKKVFENVQKAVTKLSEEGIEADAVKLDVTAKETISKYGVLMSPAIAVNGVVRFMGKVVDSNIIKRLLLKEK